MHKFKSFRAEPQQSHSKNASISPKSNGKMTIFFKAETFREKKNQKGNENKSYFGMGDVDSQGIKRMMQNEFKVLGHVMSPTRHTATGRKREMETRGIGRR